MDINNPLIQPSSPAYQEYLAAQQNAAQSSAQNTIAAMQKQNEPKPKAVDKYAPQQGFYTYNKHTADDKSGLWDVYTDAWEKIKGYRDEQGVIDYLKAQPAGTKLKQLSRWEHAPETQHQRQTYVNYFLDNDGNLMYQLEKPNYILKPDDGGWQDGLLGGILKTVGSIASGGLVPAAESAYKGITSGDSDAWKDTFTAGVYSTLGGYQNYFNGGNESDIVNGWLKGLGHAADNPIANAFNGFGTSIGTGPQSYLNNLGLMDDDTYEKNKEYTEMLAHIVGLAAIGGTGDVAAEPIANASEPVMNGLETYTMGGAESVYPTTQQIFDTATGEFITVPTNSEAFTNYVVNNGYLGADNYMGNFYNTAEYPKFTTDQSFNLNYQDIAKDTAKKLIKEVLSGGKSAQQPTTGTGNTGFGNVADTSSPLANQITNATYPQAQATPSQVPLEGYSKFNRALTPYNLRKKKKLIEDDLYPYIA